MQILKTLSLTKQTLLNDHWEIPPIFRQKYIPSIDGLRAVSIIIVLISHLRNTENVPTWLKWAGENVFLGGLGVQIFFVISGFLITGLLLKEKLEKGHIGLRGFYWRRIVRIFPVFYLYIIVALVVGKLYELPITDEMFLGAALFSQNFSFWGTSWITGHTWSLAVEEQFYLLWPFLLKWNYKIALTCILLSIVYHPIGNVVGYLYSESEHYLMMPVFKYFPPILIGAFIALILFKGGNNTLRKIFQNPIFLLSLPLAVIIYLPGKLGLFGFFTVPFAYLTASICIGLFFLHVLFQSEETSFFKFLNTGAVKYVGVISYSIYIWQQIWIIPEGIYKNVDLWWTAFPINIIGAILTAMLSYHLFEKPLLRFKNIRKREQQQELKVETLSS